MSQSGKWVAAAVVAFAVIAALVLYRSPRVSGVSATSVTATRLPVGISVPGARVMLREAQRLAPWRSGSGGSGYGDPNLCISLWAVADQAIPGDPMELGATEVTCKGYEIKLEDDDVHSDRVSDSKLVAVTQPLPPGMLVTVRQQVLPLTKGRQARFAFTNVTNADLPQTRRVANVTITLRGLRKVTRSEDPRWFALGGSAESPMLARLDVTAPRSFKWSQYDEHRVTTQSGSELSIRSWSQSGPPEEERPVAGAGGGASSQVDPNQVVKTHLELLFEAGPGVSPSTRFSLKLSGVLPPGPGDGMWVTFERVRVP